MTGVEIAGLAFSALGTAVSAMGSMQASRAQQSALKTSEEVAKRNALIARQQTEAEASDMQRKQRRELGAIRALYGASGLDLAGSPLDVLEDTATEQALDVSRVRTAGEMRAIGQLDKAQQYSSAADALAKQEPYNALAGFIGAGSSLLKNPTVKNKLESWAA